MSEILQELRQARRATPEVFHETPPARWRRQADLALDGVLLFYGRQPVRVGRRDIDWSGAHVQHQEWPAQLNRFGYLEALRWAYRLTGRDEYAAAARDYIEDWLDQRQPYRPDAGPHPVPGESTLNMAVRLGGLAHPGWLGALGDLMASPAFDETFALRIVESIDWQLDWLAANLPVWGNWRIAALDCLFSQALRLPGRFSRHLRPAAEALSVEFAAQILPDGVHLERSAGYHDWMCRVFLKLWKLGRRRLELPLRLDGERVARMHSYTLAHTKPNGCDCGFNDAASRFRCEDDNQTLAARLAEQQALRVEAGIGQEPPGFSVFAAAGQVFYRTGWSPDDIWWAFDAAGWGGGHTHLSRLSVELHNGRRTTLPDPGIFTYSMLDAFGPAGKSTPAHSTMNVNLGNQADVDARLLRAVELPELVLAQGRYEGSYWAGAFGWRFSAGRGRGWFGSHDRIVLWLKDRAMVVLDSLLHDPGTTAYLHWLSDDVPVKLDGQQLRFWTAAEEGNVCIRVLPIGEVRATGAVRRGEKDPYLGWVAEQGVVRPAPLFQCRLAPATTEGGPGPGTVSTQCVSVIVPFVGPEPPGFTASVRAGEGYLREVELHWADGRVDRVVYTERLAVPLRRVGELWTDAELLVISHLPGADGDQVARVGGTYVRRE